MDFGSCVGKRLYGGFFRKEVLVVLIIGLVIRYFVGFFLTYTYDVHSWALIISNFESGNGLYDVAGFNYTPPWGYILGTFSVIAEMFGLDVFGERFTEALPVEEIEGWFFSASAPSIAFALAIKTMYFIVDIAVGYAIYWIVGERTSDDRKALIGFALWFLCPLVIAVGGIGGMFDTFTVLLTLLTVIFLMRDRYLLAGMCLGTAALMKIFPGVFVFVMIAYVILKHRGDGKAVPALVQSFIGLASIIVILLLPQILDGTLSDCFGFLTSRAGDGMGVGGDLVTYGTIAAYAAILVVTLLLAYRTARGSGNDPDGTLLTMLMVNGAVLFLYPSTPQYIMLLIPFLIVQLVTVDSRYRVPYILFAIGTTMFSLGGNATFLIPLAGFTDLVSMDTVLAGVEWFHTSFAFGIAPIHIIYYGGAALQYLGTLMTLFTFAKVRGDAHSAETPETA